ncbi:hypothetical protein KPH14_000801, partial [Odynerus spinipes]
MHVACPSGGECMRLADWFTG